MLQLLAIAQGVTSPALIASSAATNKPVLMFHSFSRHTSKKAKNAKGSQQRRLRMRNVEGLD
jgi:hypothetical protein